MATEPIIVDSSVWVAYFYPKDSQHKRAVQLLEQELAPITVPEYVLLETATILRQKKEEGALKDFLKAVMNKGVYQTSATLGEHTASLYSNPKFKKLSFVDVSLVILSKKYRVITFDKALQQAINQTK